MDTTQEPGADPRLTSTESRDDDLSIGGGATPEPSPPDEGQGNEAPLNAETAPAEELPPYGAAAARSEDLVARLDRFEERLGESLERLLRELESRWSQDRFREKQVDTLHAELQEHKRDLLGRVVQPVLQGVIRLHGDLSKTVEALQTKDPEDLTPTRFFRVLEGFHEDLELLLERHGVHRFENPGEEFEPSRQTALRTEPAPRSDLAGRILARIRPGFEQGDALLRKEGVAVWAASLESAEPIQPSDKTGQESDEPDSDDMEETQ